MKVAEITSLSVQKVTIAPDGSVVHIKDKM